MTAQEATGVNVSNDKRMRLRYAGTCRLCGTELSSRTDAFYERSTRTVRCVECPTKAAAVGVDKTFADIPRQEAGVAGDSARREYERRKARDEERLRQKWGKLGGVAVALSDEKPSTRAWATGAIGEERLGARLDSLASESIAVLHDRRVPGTMANIDHIVITRSGIWVIDAKRYKGRPDLKIEGGILRPRVERLLVGRRDCTDLVDGVLKQVQVVRQVVGDLPVTGALCFIEADWPLVGAAFTTRGVHVLSPRRLARHLTKAGEGSVDVSATCDVLASRFPSA